MSHMHWDHIMGFPFFGPAYVPGTRLRIYGCHADLEEALPPAAGAALLPGAVRAARRDHRVRARCVPGETHEVAGVKVTPRRSSTRATRTATASSARARAVVYTTDSEHKLEEPRETERFVDFFRDADLVIFDAMYSLAEAISVKADWGHSSNVVGVELCQMAQREAPRAVPPRAGQQR